MLLSFSFRNRQRAENAIKTILSKSMIILAYPRLFMEGRAPMGYHGGQVHHRLLPGEVMKNILTSIEPSVAVDTNEIIQDVAVLIVIAEIVASEIATGTLILCEMWRVRYLLKERMLVNYYCSSWKITANSSQKDRHSFKPIHPIHHRRIAVQVLKIMKTLETEAIVLLCNSRTEMT